MTCPYCAEEIKDEAIVCRYCGRDFLLIKPLEERLRSLERKYVETQASLAEITESLRHLDSRPKSTTQLRQFNTPSYLQYFIVVLLPLIITSLCLIATRYSPWMWLRVSFVMVALASPAILGSWLGIKWHGSHLRTYLKLGLIIGLIEVPVSILIVDAGFHPELYDITTLYYALIVVGRAALFFITGGLFGDWIERKRMPSILRRGFAEKMAEKIINAGNTPPTIQGPSYEVKIKSLANIISGLAPILTLISSIVSAYLGYLAALAVAAKAK